jgi:hypothetical protein
MLQSSARQMMLNCSRQAGKSTSTALLPLLDVLKTEFSTSKSRSIRVPPTIAT